MSDDDVHLKKKWTKKDLLLPIASGACYGIAHTLRKGGLNLVPSPTVGVIAQNIGAMVFVIFSCSLAPTASARFTLVRRAGFFSGSLDFYKLL